MFFVFLVVVLLFIFTPTFSCCCSYCQCSTDSNLHTVVLFKPVSYSPATFLNDVNMPTIILRCLRVGMGKVRQLCGFSALAGVAIVRLRYGGSTGK